MNHFWQIWIFEGPRTDVFEAAIGRPWIEPNDAVFTLKLIFGLARNGLDFGPKNDLKIIFLNFIWKTKIHKIIGNSQWNKAFLQNKIITYIFKSLTPLKTALKNYTCKVCVLPQQNAFGRPFSLKKHEEMFCDFAKTSCFFNENGLPNAFCWGKTQTLYNNTKIEPIPGQARN